MQIYSMTLGMIGTNVYIAVNEATKEALIVDPADCADRIVARCKTLGVKPCAILLTHGHFDHILAVNELRALLNVPVYALDREQALLADPALNSSINFGEGCRVVPDRFLKDGETLSLMGIDLLVLATPGHTAGSACYYFKSEKVLFSGDTLFRGSCGRTDLATGSTVDICRSLKKLVEELPEDTVVYPGHMDSTTIGREKRYNPFV